MQNPSSRGTNRKKRPWSRIKPLGADAAGTVCWKESRVWAQLLGFLWLKKVQLSMQLLPSRAGVVISQCSVGPDTGDWSWSGSRQGTRPTETGNIQGFQTFCHIIVYLGGEDHPRSRGAHTLKTTQWVLMSLPPPRTHGSNELTMSRALALHQSVNATGREPASGCTWTSH